MASSNKSQALELKPLPSAIFPCSSGSVNELEATVGLVVALSCLHFTFLHHSPIHFLIPNFSHCYGSQNMPPPLPTATPTAPAPGHAAHKMAGDLGDPVVVLHDRGVMEANKSNPCILVNTLKQFKDFRPSYMSLQLSSQLIAITKQVAG